MEIYQWEEIKQDFQDTILIGNGGSIAIDDCFNYKSIFQYAVEKNLFADETIKLFTEFKTENFELVLKYILHAKTVNKILNIKYEELNNQYEKIKNNLIEIIRKIHPDYYHIENDLSKINHFLQNFKTAISLNYDLTLYWAIMLDKDRYIDYFKYNNNQLEFNASMNNQNRTEIFYLHGNLILGKDRYGNTIKLRANEKFNLASQIGNSWEDTETTPLFVSEGTAKNKLTYIQNHYYLNHIYNNILPCINHKSLTIYGWSFSEQDEHILKRILGFRCRYEHVLRKKIAISIFNNNYEECRQIENKIKNACVSKLQPEIIFFDSQSNQCWNN